MSLRDHRRSSRWPWRSSPADPTTTAAATTEPTAVSTTESAPGTDPVATDPVATDPVATDAPAVDRATGDGSADDRPSDDRPTDDRAGHWSRTSEAAGLATIDLLPTDAGEQPLLSWTPVAGAASYRMAALTSDGSPYWAWIGEATDVRFGGLPEVGGQTAIVFEPMTWRVVALDAEGLPIAASEPGELTP